MCIRDRYDTDQYKNKVNAVVFENIRHQSLKYFSRILNARTALHSSAGSTHSAAHRSWHYDSPPFSSKSPPPVWVWASYTLSLIHSCFGKLDATDDEVIAAAKLANADTFIRQLPDGYNTVLTLSLIHI